MSYIDAERPLYFPEEYNYSINYQNEFSKDKSKTLKLPLQPNKSHALPNIAYLNERKCPIYIHYIKNDSSVRNNYNEPLISPKFRNHQNNAKITSLNASKFVLDKLEETYWATWKPKKESKNAKNVKSPEAKPIDFTRNLIKAHGDVNDNIIKHFKATDFKSASTTASETQNEIAPVKNVSNEPKTTEITANSNTSSKKKLRRPGKFTKTSPRASQEIQTEFHCPVILPLEQHVEEENDNKGDEPPLTLDDENKNANQKVKKTNKRKNNLLKKKKSKKGNTKTAEQPQHTTTTEESEVKIIEHKDSIVIAKEKQEKGDKEHYQQPKCIRLYRKPGSVARYLKGGTYPLKSCLKRDNLPAGSFRLGAPGSPLFVTSSSFSSKKRK